MVRSLRDASKLKPAAAQLERALPLAPNDAPYLPDLLLAARRHGARGSQQRRGAQGVSQVPRSGAAELARA